MLRRKCIEQTGKKGLALIPALRDPQRHQGVVLRRSCDYSTQLVPLEDSASPKVRQFSIKTFHLAAHPVAIFTELPLDQFVEKSSCMATLQGTQRDTIGIMKPKQTFGSMQPRRKLFVVTNDLTLLQ